MSDSFTLITGASSGIGRAIAERLSTHQRLILHGRDVARLEQTRQACCMPDQHCLWQADLANVDEIEVGLTGLLTDHNIKIGHYVHAAGVVAVYPSRMMDPNRVRQTMDVNFASAVEIVRVLVKKKPNENALKAIVFLSSIASRRGTAGFSVYSASKGAIDAYMRSLAVELAPQVRVNTVSPGSIRTPGTERFFQDKQFMEQCEKDYPLGLGLPDDIAAAVEFMLSDESRWITGQDLIVDGGRTAH